MSGPQPAFPVSPGVEFEDRDDVQYQGMWLRDWFAGQALAGLMANERGGDGSPKYAYWLADAMLIARGDA